MRPDETVAEMAEEVLSRQARALVAQTGELFESALEAVSSTHAGQQLRDRETVSIAMRRHRIGRGACSRSAPRGA